MTVCRRKCHFFSRSSVLFCLPRDGKKCGNGTSSGRSCLLQICDSAILSNEFAHSFLYFFVYLPFNHPFFHCRLLRMEKGKGRISQVISTKFHCKKSLASSLHISEILNSLWKRKEEAGGTHRMWQLIDDVNRRYHLDRIIIASRWNCNLLQNNTIVVITYRRREIKFFLRKKLI